VADPVLPVEPEPVAEPELAVDAGPADGMARAESADPAEGMPPAPHDAVRMRMVVGYDGSGFRGFARQPGQRTVSGELARAISNFCRHQVELVCAGRTDAGVHAQGQVVHVDVAPSVDAEALKRGINRQLSPEVVVRSAERAGNGFDARRSATSRSYRYLVLQSDEPDPLLADLAWHVSTRLDLRPMRAAADALLGEHDFSAFCRKPPGHPAGAPITRRILEARWCVASFPGDEAGLPGGSLASRGIRQVAESQDGDRLLRFDVRATSFCHQMVRSIVGVLTEVGKGRMKPSDIPRLLESGDRAEAKTLAPPHGMCLIRVDYAD